ncbi:MAG: glycosyltransferase family 2 protein [Patescibacteria group bacterium]|nr:glycosyltransferase family 2 protein [Patescibacteria group bacterium]
MKLSIIIVSWNVAGKLKENLKAIYFSDLEKSNFEVFVVDNNSEDDTVGIVRKEFPQVKLIVNFENFGFAKANNQAIKQVKGEYILLLNPDMRVKNDTFKNMLKWMDENPQARVAGCKLVNETGEIIKHVRCFPKILDQLAIVLKLPHIFPNILNKYLINDFDYEKQAKVDSIRGGFFLVRNNAAGTQNVETQNLASLHIAFPKLKLDERYFLWFEEVDFCLQIKNASEEAWYTPAAECVDYVGQSFKQVDTAKKQKYFRDSQLKYFKKWHPAWQYYLLKIAWVFGVFILFVFKRMNFKSKAKT